MEGAMASHRQGGDSNGGDSNGNGKRDVDLDDHPLGIYREILREALGQILADQRHEWSKERRRMETELQAFALEAHAVIADLRAEVATIDHKFWKAIQERLCLLLIRGFCT
jgi:hypothetical protein